MIRIKALALAIPVILGACSAAPAPRWQPWQPSPGNNATCTAPAPGFIADDIVPGSSVEAISRVLGSAPVEQDDEGALWRIGDGDVVATMAGDGVAMIGVLVLEGSNACVFTRSPERP